MERRPVFVLTIDLPYAADADPVRLLLPKKDATPISTPPHEYR